MKGKITMTQEGQKRVKAMEMLMARIIDQSEAGKLIGIGTRQVKRLAKQYREKGDEGLNHGLIGKKSNNRKNEIEKEEILALVRNEFKGYKPTFISEKLEEVYHKTIKANTLRLWMIEAGLWEKTRKAGIHRVRRARKGHFGEMIQMDGSPHDWFGTGEEFCLMNMMDDATNIEFGLFDTAETTDIALRALYHWVEQYGVPQSIYTDHGSVYYLDKEPTIEEQLKGIVPRTRFGQVCADLGIDIIYAGSPQAKGRIERANGIQQDRLIAELRYLGINNIASANAYMLQHYWDRNNSKFRKKPLFDDDYHVPLVKGQDLRNIVCYKDVRSVSSDYVVRNDNRFFQLRKTMGQPVKPRDKVVVRCWLDGTVHITKNEIELDFKEISDQVNRIIA